MSSPLHDSPADPAWHQLAPLLDDALGRLGRKDREALILRYFKDQKLDEVAAALEVTEVAAQRRVHRAVEKLRKYFSRRGVVLPATVLTAALAANSVHAAPAALAQSISTVAVAKCAAAGGSTLIKGALKLMAWTKMKTVVVLGASVLLAAGWCWLPLVLVCGVAGRFGMASLGHDEDLDSYQLVAGLMEQGRNV